MQPSSLLCSLCSHPLSSAHYAAILSPLLTMQPSSLLCSLCSHPLSSAHYAAILSPLLTMQPSSLLYSLCRHPLSSTHYAVILSPLLTMQPSSSRDCGASSLSSICYPARSLSFFHYEACYLFSTRLCILCLSSSHCAANSLSVPTVQPVLSLLLTVQPVLSLYLLCSQFSL